jgi:alpha-tubulin suppressor-like RCC1 family protein
MPLVTLVQQSSTGTTAFNNTYPDPINKMGNKWSQSGSGLTRSSTGGIVGSNNYPLAYRVDTPSQRVSATGVQGLTTGDYYFLLNANASSATAGNYLDTGSLYRFALRGGFNPYVQKVENGVGTNVANITTAGTWWSATLTSVVLDCTIPGTVTASITYGGNTYSTSYTDPYPIQGNWASYQIWDNGGGNAQTATSLVIETLSVATVPLSIGTRSSSTVTVSTQEPANVDGHSYAYKVTLTATSTVTNVGDKLVTGANSYVITAVTGTILTVVGDPFSTTAAPSTGSATTRRSYSSIDTWAAAAPNLSSKDWIWKGILFKEGSNPGGEWNMTVLPEPPAGSDAARYFWLTAAPGQSFRDNMTAGTALSYNTNTGVTILTTGNYVYLMSYTNLPYVLYSGLQVKRTATGGIGFSPTNGLATFDSCILWATSWIAFHSNFRLKNSIVQIDAPDTSLNSQYTAAICQFYNCTLIGPGSGYAIREGGSGNSAILKNCAIFGWSTATSNISFINQGRSINNATNLSTLGWTSTGTVVNLTTSSQFNNAASGALDFRIREYSSLINNAVRDQQYTGDADIIGRARSTAAPTIGAWEYLSNRIVTGIQSRNPQTGAVVDMGSYYVSKDYGLDVYPNLVPGRTSPGLYAWGLNSGGQLGQGDTTDRSSPVQIGSLTTWKTISNGGDEVSLAIKNDGTLWSFGYNVYGQLGLGDTASRSSLIQVGADNKWKYVAGGFGHIAAIKTDGTLWTWGRNNYGQLGIGDTTNRSNPVQVGSGTGWRYVALQGYNTYAIKTDGTLWGWGSSTGNLSDAYGYTPGQVGGLTNWSQLACGYAHTVAVKTDGTLWAWGNNQNGSVGVGNTSVYASPVQIGSLNNWKYVAAGGYTCYATKTDGTLWTWGRNDYGQLGIGNTVDYSSPIQIGSLTNWKTVSGGTKAFVGNMVCAIKTDGTLWAWGRNTFGGLGQGNTVHYSSPVQVGSLTTWKSATASSYHIIAISDGQV